MLVATNEEIIGGNFAKLSLYILPGEIDRNWISTFCTGCAYRSKNQRKLIYIRILQIHVQTVCIFFYEFQKSYPSCRICSTCKHRDVNHVRRSCIRKRFC